MDNQKSKQKFNLAPFLKDIKEQIVNSQVWKSTFRHGYADTAINRIWLPLNPNTQSWLKNLSNYRGRSI